MIYTELDVRFYAPSHSKTNYLKYLNFNHLIAQLVRINTSNMNELNNNILPKTSHPKPASAH